jgi:hypothetical protein
VAGSHLSCAPRIGLQANAVQRARRMRLESPASPPTLCVKERGQYKYSVENALLTGGSRPPPQPKARPCRAEPLRRSKAMLC